MTNSILFQRARRAAGVAALVLGLLASRASATWSIVLVDTATGEVAVGVATCLDDFDLKKTAPVVRVGKGAGSAQGTPNPSASNRKIIYDGLGHGTPPAQMIALIQATDSDHHKRQFGIVDHQGAKVSYTGSSTKAWKGGLTGSVGTIHYAIQGNLLTGQAVVTAAQQAVVGTSGDLAAKLMAGMQAARAKGGDGRCSCNPNAPTACGSPPPSFSKSAHVGTMVLARIGDVDGGCDSNGCAKGKYYLDLNVAGDQGNKPDAVAQLQTKFDAWRQSWLGRPDHLRSEVTLVPGPLASDGAAPGGALIRLRDWTGAPLTKGGAAITLIPMPGSDGVSSPGAVVDNGDGSYSVPLFTGAATGSDTYRIVVNDGKGAVTLYPFLEVPVAEAHGLEGDKPFLWAALGTDLRVTFEGGEALAGKPYLLLSSASGTSPGFAIGPLHVPLHPDMLTLISVLHANSPTFVNTFGVLDATGSASMAATFSPGDLSPLAPGSLAFVLVTVAPSDYASQPLVVPVHP